MQYHEYSEYGMYRLGNFRFFAVIVFIAVCILLILAFFVKYPDRINTIIEITPASQPLIISSKINGYTEKLFVKNNQQVYKNDTLLLMRSSVNYNDLLMSKKIVNGIYEYLTGINAVEGHDFKPMLKLGELSSFYSRVVDAYQSLNYLWRKNPYLQRIQALHVLQSQQNVFLSRLKKKKNIVEQVNQLAHKNFIRDSLLFLKQSIAEKNFEQSKTNYLQSMIESNKIHLEINKAEREKATYAKEIIDLQCVYNEEEQKLKNACLVAVSNYFGKINEWENFNIIKSSSEGMVTFLRSNLLNTYIKEGEEIISITPIDDSSLKGFLQLPINKAGKVKVNQKVITKIHNFPYKEFGLLEGKISYISTVPSSGFYLTEVDFLEGATTSYGINLSIMQKMKGDASILTRQRSVFKRLFLPFKSVIAQQKSYNQ